MYECHCLGMYRIFPLPPLSADHSMEEAERKRLLSEVHSLLQSEMLACDVLVSLLCAAASSLRHDSLVKPFPPSIPDTTGGHRDITQLVTHHLLLLLFLLPLSSSYAI